MADQGPGKVYVMQDDDEYKIGAAVDPGDRLYQVRQTRPNAKLIHRVDANNKLDAERAAQAAVEHQLGMKKVVGGPSDWYTNPQKASTHKITGVVDQAVHKSNQRN